MFLRFQKIALDVSYGFGRNRSMFLIVVFLIEKVCIDQFCKQWNEGVEVDAGTREMLSITNEY